MEILYSSNTIHSKIKKLFANPSDNDRRIVIVAFIGSDVKSFLPAPKNMLIICNPNPVATSIDAISYLINKGAKVMFSNSLHMKVYYSSERGCVITSANLSNNALGSGKLKEAGVYLSSKDVDIDRLIDVSKPYELTKEALIDLDIKSKKIITALKKLEYNIPKDKPVDFLDWFSSREHKLWKLGWYEDIDVPFSKLAIEQTKSDYGKKEPFSLMNYSKGQTSEADWILCFKINSKTTISNIEWMYIDFIVPIPKEDKAYDPVYCYQSIQVNPNSKYPAPPFIITKEFKRAFIESLKEFGIDDICKRKDLSPPLELLELIKIKYA